MEFLASLHPKIVHFPIVLFLSYVILELAGLVLKKQILSDIAIGTLMFGLLFAILSVLSGEQAARLAQQNKYLVINPRFSEFYQELISRHESYATYSVWIFSFLCIAKLHLIIRTRVKKQFIKRLQLINILLLILAIIGAYMIFLTGETGGVMVYEHGIGTKLFTPDSTKIIP